VSLEFALEGFDIFGANGLNGSVWLWGGQKLALIRGLYRRITQSDVIHPRFKSFHLTNQARRSFPTAIPKSISSQNMAGKDFLAFLVAYGLFLTLFLTLWCSLGPAGALRRRRIRLSWCLRYGTRKGTKMWIVKL